MEDKIKHIVGTACEKFPTSIRAECHNFVDTYGDAVIALLIQNIDPRDVCPRLKFCPKNSFNEDMEVFAPQPIDVSITHLAESPSCPLCLFAVMQAQQMVKNEKTKARVIQVLDSLCTHAPKKLQSECIDFVDTYYSELSEMLITDFTPQQICVYFKLCTENSTGLEDVNISVDSNEDIMTNEIPDNTINGSPKYEILNNNSGPECLLCKKIIGEALKNLISKKSKEHIKEELERACERVHKLKNKCRSYVDKYGDKIVELIMKELSAKEICQQLMFCATIDDDEDLEIDEALKIDIIAIPSSGMKFEKLAGNDEANVSDPPCALCEFIMVKLEQELKDKKTQDEIKNTIHSICKKMPSTLSKKCDKFVDQYGDMVLDLLDTVPPKQICEKLQLCVTLEGKINDDVVECGVCHGAVMVLVPKIKENSEIEAQEMIEEACENLPAKYYGQCSDLIAYYGESISNLVKMDTEQSEICAKIGKCFREENSITSYLRIGGVRDFDLSTVREIRSSDQELVGSDSCTFGPSFWCEKKENAEKCGTHTYCVDKKQGYAKESSTA